MFHVKRQGDDVPTFMERFHPMHPSYPLRASFAGYNQSTAKIHAFDGVRATCGRTPEKSAWAHPAFAFHTPTTYPTCQGCRDHGEYPTHYSRPELQRQAAGALVVHALADHDPHVLTAALRLLSARPELEALAALIATAADQSETDRSR